MDEILLTSEVSELTRIPVTTLRWYRHKGIGPRSFTLGPKKVAYLRRDVDNWLAEQYKGPAA